MTGRPVPVGPVALLGRHDWGSTTIPGSAPEVAILRLHVDPTTRASTSLVRFPAGWARPGIGHYPVGEEILVLDGELVVSGVRYRAGDYGWLPPYARRAASATPTGALCLAWFSGPPVWTPGEAEWAAGPGRQVALAAAGADPLRTDLGWSGVLAGVPPDAGPVEVVTLADWTWRVAAGEAAAEAAAPGVAGTVFLRR